MAGARRLETHRMINKRTETQASLYVLGTLSPEEARVFEAAMRADPKLRLLVKELRGTTGSKVGAFPQTNPQPDLQQQMLAPAGGFTNR